MKKILGIILLCLTVTFFSACEISNTELANSLEGNMTRLVYSIGYLDSVSTEEISGLVNNSSYFSHSSLYAPNAINQTDELSSTSIESIASDSSGLFCSPNTGFRSRTYYSSYNDGAESSLLDRVNSSGTATTSGVVDMTLLEENANILNEVLLEVSTKRGIIMLYCTDLRSGKSTLSPEDKLAISEYNDIIKESTNYLNNNSGSLTTHFNSISSISASENSAELINAKLIRANEILKTRYAKLDTCLDSLDAIINILINSMGYNYSELYTNSLNNTTNQIINGTNNVTLEENVSTDNSSVINSNLNDTSITESTTTTETTNTPTTYPIYNESTTTPSNNCNNCSPNTTTNNCNNCENTTFLNNDCDKCDNSEQGDTIVNYNYSGNNSSNINNTNDSSTITTPLTTTPLNKTDTVVDPNPAVVDNQNSTPITNSTLDLEQPNETEIILNGGLTKNRTQEKIPANNIDSMIASAKPINQETSETETAKELKLARPVKSNKKIENSPEFPIQTLEERNESSPITDDNIAPLPVPYSNQTTSPEFSKLTPLKTAPELGFVPIKYQEDNPIMQLPRL